MMLDSDQIAQAIKEARPDNMIYVSDKFRSGCNSACDYIAISLAEGLSPDERRIFFLASGTED